MKAWAPPILLYILISIQSSFSLNEISSVFSFQDKVAHFIVYGLLGALITRGALRGRHLPGVMIPLMVGAGVASILGVVDELHQSWTPGRFPDLYDGIADSVGAICGASLYALVFVRRRSRGENDASSDELSRISSPDSSDSISR